MNFQDYKAKHAKLATSTKTTVDTTAAKIDASVKKGALKTKEVAANTGNFITGSVPVTSRKHNAFASEVNAKLNGVSRHLEYHEVLFDVLSDYVGAELPSKETVYQYLDQKEAEAQQEAAAATPVVQEELVAGIVSRVLSSLGINQSPLSAEGQAFIEEQQGKAPTAAQEKAAEAGEDVEQADIKAKKEQRRLAALAKKQIEEAAVEQQEEPEVEEEVEEKEKPVKKIKRRRKAGGMGRQEPLAAE